MKELKAAFLDDGINSNYFPELNNIESYTVENGKVKECSGKDFGDKLTHGTICLKVFMKYVKVKVSIISIEILNSNKRCSADTLVIALNWARVKGIKIINMSLGSSFFQDELCLRKCVNDLAKIGHIIISAQNNSNYVTYPANFTNVIGVSAGHGNQKLKINNDYIFTGIEFLAKSEHKIEVKSQIVTKYSNSFATPYVTALVSNLYSDEIHVLEMKEKLCTLIMEENFKLIKFDWCNNAVILQSVDYVEHDLCIEVTPCEEPKETIVVVNGGVHTGTIEENIDAKYLLLLNGKEDNTQTLDFDLKRTLIVNEQNLKSVFSADAISKVEEPFITIYYNKSKMLEAFHKIREERDKFLVNGYNCKIFADNSISILYGFEICVEGLCVESYIEFYMVDLIIILLDMEKQIKYIEGDINLRFGTSELSKECNMLINIEEENVYEYIVSHS